MTDKQVEKIIKDFVNSNEYAELDLTNLDISFHIHRNGKRTAGILVNISWSDPEKVWSFNTVRCIYTDCTLSINGKVLSMNEYIAHELADDISDFRKQIDNDIKISTALSSIGVTDEEFLTCDIRSIFNEAFLYRRTDNSFCRIMDKLVPHRDELKKLVDLCDVWSKREVLE